MLIWTTLFLLSLGALMCARGLVYVLRPASRMAEKRRQQNLRYGLPTDMRLFGRRVLRLGYLVMLAGAWLWAWEVSDDVRRPAVEASP